ncbi:MAG: M67 family metallopeptidase [Thermoprotei archaeon]|nr:M67 family metallopeptidase [Thermoprotei archaeon]
MSVPVVKLGVLGEVLKLMALGAWEATGFLVGSLEPSPVRVFGLYRVDNRLGSPLEFEGDPWQTVQAHVSAGNYGIQVVALFHTHTSCPPLPSSLDVKGMKLWPIIWVIACPGEIRAWRLDESGGLQEVFVE